MRLLQKITNRVSKFVLCKYAIILEYPTSFLTHNFKRINLKYIEQE